MKVAPLSGKSTARRRRRVPRSYRAALRRTHVAALLRGARTSRARRDLEVGSGSHAVQTAEVMKRSTGAARPISPTVVLVVGDVNSTLACALTAVKLACRSPTSRPASQLRPHDARGDQSHPDRRDQRLALRLRAERPRRICAWRTCRRAHPFRRQRHDRYADRLPAAVRSRADPGQSSASSPAGYSVLTMHRPANVDGPRSLLG